MVGINFEDWEQRKLETLVNRVKSYSLSRDVETIEHSEYRYVHYGDIHTKVADVIDESSLLPSIKPGNYELLCKHDLILADASEDYQGIASPAVVTISLPYNLVAGLHTIALRPISVDSMYLYYIFNSRNFRKHGYRVGTGMKVFGISVSNVLNFVGRFPSIDEQQKVGKFLKKIDDTIALHQDKLDKLKQLKKGYLQVIFSQKGENTPRLRFANFSSAWEQRKAKELFQPIVEKGQPELPLLSVTQDSGVVYRDQVGIDIKYDSATLKNYKVIHPGNFVISLRSFQGGFEISDKHGITSPAYTIFVPKYLNEQDSLFWKVQFKTFKFIESLKTVTFGIRDGKSISFSEFGDLKLLHPSNVKEQQIIGNFFEQLDEIITFHQRKISTLQEIKKTYLQKMFV
ncbi:MAG: restriction endonuclease subunit S [Carnobacterium sp.]|uniref:restriction endonuclease subunit S n=1 Tax=Carnobacterium sp. TaxID=48221 RepID=UPI00331526A1